MPTAPSPRRILVVDDDADTARTFAALLETLGHHAAYITDSRAVLGTVRRDRPDALFLDIGMPHLNGFQVGRLVKQEFRDICVVAISGHDSEEHRQDARRAHFDAYIAKPVDMAMLESILQTLYGSGSAG